MLVAVGAVRWKWWGVVRLSFHFLYLVVSFSGGQLSVVGFVCYILRFFFGEFVVFFFSCGFVF